MVCPGLRSAMVESELDALCMVLRLQCSDCMRMETQSKLISVYNVSMGS